jgi:hypothetical protein
LVGSPVISLRKESGLKIAQAGLLEEFGKRCYRMSRRGMANFEIFSLVSSGATAIGVLIACSQIRATKRLHLVQFEDGLTRQFRDVMDRLPVEALLGEQLAELHLKKHLRCFYRYFDLANEQVFLRSEGRVSKSTWNTWHDGILTLMSLPAFERAWKIISGKDSTRFDELRLLEAGRYKDPRSRGFRQELKLLTDGRPETVSRKTSSRHHAFPLRQGRTNRGKALRSDTEGPR